MNQIYESISKVIIDEDQKDDYILHQLVLKKLMSKIRGMPMEHRGQIFEQLILILKQ